MEEYEGFEKEREESPTSNEFMFVFPWDEKSKRYNISSFSPSLCDGIVLLKDVKKVRGAFEKIPRAYQPKNWDLANWVLIFLMLIFTIGIVVNIFLGKTFGKTLALIGWAVFGGGLVCFLFSLIVINVMRCRFMKRRGILVTKTLKELQEDLFDRKGCIISISPLESYLKIEFTWKMLANIEEIEELIKKGKIRENESRIVVEKEEEIRLNAKNVEIENSSSEEESAKDPQRKIIQDIYKLTESKPILEENASEYINEMDNVLKKGQKNRVGISLLLLNEHNKKKLSNMKGSSTDINLEKDTLKDLTKTRNDQENLGAKPERSTNRSDENGGFSLLQTQTNRKNKYLDLSENNNYAEKKEPQLFKECDPDKDRKFDYDPFLNEKMDQFQNQTSQKDHLENYYQNPDIPNEFPEEVPKDFDNMIEVRDTMGHVGWENQSKNKNLLYLTKRTVTGTGSSLSRQDPNSLLYLPNQGIPHLINETKGAAWNDRLEIDKDMGKV